MSGILYKTEIRNESIANHCLNKRNADSIDLRFKQQTSVKCDKTKPVHNPQQIVHYVHRWITTDHITTKLG